MVKDKKRNIKGREGKERSRDKIDESRKKREEGEDIERSSGKD